MASNSKKRRRVLGVSCILAALIIASSSFAWFTSKDEVTNRLTASSDYGVSIVESFAPPKNWLPGEDVNKDVYAVNTGNIDAFVKENIQGVLNYTYEDVVVDFGTADTKYVELTLDQVKAIQGQTTEDGFKTYEAGGYLAWTDATASETTKNYEVSDVPVELTTGLSVKAYANATDAAAEDGGKTFTVSYTDETGTYYAESATDGATLYKITADGVMTGKDKYEAVDGKTLKENTVTTTTPVESGSIYEGRTSDLAPKKPWTPTETGVYVFRRSINPQTATSQGKDIGNPFTYSGYYFVKGEGDTPDKYYKIVLGGDSYPAADRQEVTVDGKTRVDFVYDIFADSTDIVTNPLDDTQIDQETGEIKTDVGYMFVVEKEVKDQDVTFTMDEEHDRLVAEYTIAYEGDGTYDAKAVLARAQVDYENAKGAYDAAKAHYDNAVANRVYAEELAAAEQKLWKALDDFQEAYDKVNDDGSKAAWEDARDAVNNAAKYTDAGANAEATPAVTKPDGFTAGVRDLSSDAVTNNYNELADGLVALKPVSVGAGEVPAGIMPDEVMQAIGDPEVSPEDNPYVLALNDTDSDFYKAFENYSNIYKEIYGNDMTGTTDGLYKKVTDELSNIQTYSASTLTLDTKKAAEAKQESEKLKLDAEALKKKMAALKKAYANFVDEKKKVTGLETDDNDPNNSPGVAALTSMGTLADDFYTNADKLDKLVKDYVDAEEQYQKDQDALDEKQDAWQKALKTYNEEAGAAKTKYTTALGKLDTLDGTGTAWDSNNRKHEDEDASVETVKYSAVKKGTGEGATDPTDPMIPGSTTEGVYKDLYEYTGTGDLPATINLRDQSTFINGTGHDEIAELKVTDYIGVETQTGTSDVKKTEKQWKDAIDNAETGYNKKLADAKHAYDVATAQNNNGSTLKFYVNLDSEYEEYWQFDTNTDNAANPTFYYRYVLEAGETSHKLIDSVEFDKDVSAGAYKDMTFDLNVGLDSAQVTYDDNQRLYETDAVDGNNAFVLKVTNPTTAFDADTQLTWGTPATT